MAANSGQWNNNTAFLLAATGSAVGLGNIWGFPYKAGENGGGFGCFKQNEKNSRCYEQRQTIFQKNY